MRGMKRSAQVRGIFNGDKLALYPTGSSSRHEIVWTVDEDSRRVDAVEAKAGHTVRAAQLRLSREDYDEEEPPVAVVEWAAANSLLLADPELFRHEASKAAASDTADEHVFQEALQEIQYRLHRMLTPQEANWLDQLVNKARGLPRLTPLERVFQVGPWSVFRLEYGTVYEDDGQRIVHRGREPLVEIRHDELDRRVYRAPLGELRRTPVRFGLRYGFGTPGMTADELDQIKVAVEEAGRSADEPTIQCRTRPGALA